MYIVEGNNGVGKSTFLDLIKQHMPEIVTIQEPKENWTNEQCGQSLLANFYQDMPRWSYAMEMMTMISRMQTHIHEQQQPNKLRILERSIYSGYYIFAKNDYKNGNLTDVEWNIYDKWAKFLFNNVCKPPTGFIYLQAHPDVCFARIQKRNRKSEKSYTREYAHQMNYWHEKYLIEKENLTKNLRNVPVLILDYNADIEQDTTLVEKHLAALRQFIKETSTCLSITPPQYTIIDKTTALN